MDWIMQPWPWYISGPLIGLMVPALLILTGKTFGISSSFRHINSICLPRTRITYFRDYDWRNFSWQLFFVGGIVLGGFIGNYILSTTPVEFLPESYYSLSGVIKLTIGGILVGFGTRYANGCTSGHTIMGLSNLRWPSLVASICFFLGGMTVVYIFMPLFQGW
jgi:uncharacterized membrane protein YedE/YeeE